MSLSQAVLNQDRLALSRLLTRIENDSAEGRAALDELFPHTGNAHLIGITGAPGTGKSTLVNQLALYYRKAEKRVAIVAVDPSSPFTGGAVLGDRVRMRDLSGDKNVFIRSMASRGSLGGLAQTTAAVVQVFDAAGFDVILIETVGAGQAEVDIAKLAHTTLVVEAPGLGDDIQAIKAGILEIADVLVVNKADRPGVENTERALKGMLELAHPAKRVFQHHGQQMVVEASETPEAESPIWIPVVKRTVAKDGTGIDELGEAIEKHLAFLRTGGEWAARERAQLQSTFDALIRETLFKRFLDDLSAEGYQELISKMVERSLSPWSAVQSLLNGSEE
ncbi:MAG: methylmalonyl Co-A mutase-associated GTPase MeaB [Anaerolineae bacterium]|jgi:LAO/AO transport system kinase|nr:methylmalonyl Co-A mutase-associated GTPase MeaB [Anaerolineae bacterium]MBT7071883.1 methylmalonyl Co-A mutase-associated GTPase MeaB [Anaerolineae bacterium]MBT7326479.1 methylmalonyl Co-A mutase-associated GTPase MeaB [Anaerolineae bacterium]